MSDHDGERSLGQRITSGAVGLSLMMVATGFLGYLHDKGNEKVDAGLRERMNPVGGYPKCGGQREL